MGTFIRSDFTTKDLNAPSLTAIFARDTFNRANSKTVGPLEVGNFTWTTAGSYEIKNKELFLGAMTVTPSDCWFDSGKTSGSISVKPQSLGGGLMNALLFRALGNLGFVYYARVGTHTLAQRTGTDNFTVIEPTTTEVIPGLIVGETMKVDFTPTRIICSVDGLVTHDVVNNTYGTHTRVGVTSRGSITADSPVRWKDFMML